MLSRRSMLLSLAAFGTLSACGAARPSSKTPSGEDLQTQPGGSPALRARIDHWADHYDVPRSLVHRVVQRESGYNPRARNGSYYGLMQIAPQTAGTMGFRGKPSDLLDADTNLKYAVKYLRGAWLCADGSQSAAVKWYSKGYYYEAKRRGILREVGLRA